MQTGPAPDGYTSDEDYNDNSLQDLAGELKRVKKLMHSDVRHLMKERPIGGTDPEIQQGLDELIDRSMQPTSVLGNWILQWERWGREGLIPPSFGDPDAKSEMNDLQNEVRAIAVDPAQANLLTSSHYREGPAYEVEKFEYQSTYDRTEAFNDFAETNIAEQTEQELRSPSEADEPENAEYVAPGNAEDFLAHQLDMAEQLEEMEKIASGLNLTEEEISALSIKSRQQLESNDPKIRLQRFYDDEGTYLGARSVIESDDEGDLYEEVEAGPADDDSVTKEDLRRFNKAFAEQSKQQQLDDLQFGPILFEQTEQHLLEDRMALSPKVEFDLGKSTIISAEEREQFGADSAEKLKVFLEALGRKQIQYLKKFESFEDLLYCTGNDLKKRGIPVTDRRFIFRWREKYIRGWFYPGDPKRSPYYPEEKTIRKPKVMKHRKKKMFKQSMVK